MLFSREGHRVFKNVGYGFIKAYTERKDLTKIEVELYSKKEDKSGYPAIINAAGEPEKEQPQQQPVIGYWVCEAHIALDDPQFGAKVHQVVIEDIRSVPENEHINFEIINIIK